MAIAQRSAVDHQTPIDFAAELDIGRCFGDERRVDAIGQMGQALRCPAKAFLILVAAQMQLRQSAIDSQVGSGQRLAVGQGEHQQHVIAAVGRSISARARWHP